MKLGHCDRDCPTKQYNNDLDFHKQTKIELDMEIKVKTMLRY